MKRDKLVMIPGPTPVVDSIRNEMGRAIAAFGDPDFVSDFKSVIYDLASLWNCSGQTFVVAGTGTLAMEMAIANSTKRADRVLIVSHGFFGDRFIDICERKGLVVDVIRAEWGEIVPVAKIEERLSGGNYAAMTVTHVDTSTGVLAPVDEIGEVMRKFPDTVYIVDGVCATGGHYENVDGMNIDILFTGSQKAFGVCPGLMMLWASKKAVARRASLGTIPEYYCDFDKWSPVMDDTSKYFATPAVNLIWALKKSLEIIKDEGLSDRAARHIKNADAMRKALSVLGFSVLANESCRAATLSNLIYPKGLDDLMFRSFMMAEGVVVAGGLGAYAGKMFRLGHMGNTGVDDMIITLGAIERVLAKCGTPPQFGESIAVYLCEMSK